MYIFLSAMVFVQIMDVREAVEEACDSQALKQIQTQVKLHSIFQIFLSISLCIVWIVWFYEAASIN